MEDHVTLRQVVIIGGGFAGLFAARALRHAPVAVTVVDRRAHHLFQPLLYQCAAGILSEGRIAQPLRAVLRRRHNVRCLLADATDVDVTARLVHARRPKGGSVVLPYDELIVAVGMRQSSFGHDEFAAHAPGMKSLGDALEIRRRLYRAFEMAETAADEAEQRQWLTFALVGGGPTGVERVTDIDANGLTVRDREGTATHFEARTVLWTAGVEAPPIAGAPAPAEVAMPSGAYAGRAVRHAVEGRKKPLKPFRYVDLGSAAYISRGRAVVKAGPLHLSGVPGRLTWLFIHVAFLTGFRSRLGAVLSWAVVFASGARRERAFTLAAAAMPADPAQGSGAATPLH